MIKGVFGESSVLIALFNLVIWGFGMRNDEVFNDRKRMLGGGGGGAVVQRSGKTNGFIPGSFKTLSGYLRVVSSGASSVASTVRSAASAASSIVVDRDHDASHDQVLWAGFDKLESEAGVSRQVLLLGYRSGFQVWDVEDADNVRDLVSKHDDPVSFLQMLPKPLTSNQSGDKFADSRPLLVVCAGACPSGVGTQDAPCNGGTANFSVSCSSNFLPTSVRIYSLRSQSYVHILKFRSVVYSVRCSSRVVAISQAAQVHCFDASTLERDYTILTNPIITATPGSGGVGYGPLAVGSRWLAYSGSPVTVSNSGRVCPQHLTPSASFSSNGSLVAHYAKESSKQLAAGIVTLGDMGYKKLSRYYSELLPDGNNSVHSGNPGWKGNGSVNAHLADADNVGMVIVRDIVSKSVISQFRAHKSPISALCFDPSGTLLVTASVQGHNINIFQINHGLSESSSKSDAGLSYVHLYRMQRGLTNAVIQDISFSADNNWIMISSSRGTSHLFAIPHTGESVCFRSAGANSSAVNQGLDLPNNSSVRWPTQSVVEIPHQNGISALGLPITISAVSRIKSGSNGWRGAVSAAAAATGRTSLFSGAVASSFHNCKGKSLGTDINSLKEKPRLLVFSSSGSMIQYALRFCSGVETATAAPKLNNGYESAPEGDTRVVVEAIQKWNICQKQNRREREENIDIYGENGISKGSCVYPEDSIAFTKAKLSPEEKYHSYISEAELQTLQNEIPVWGRPQIYFQSMMTDDVGNDEKYTLGGELEIERLSTRTIEVRSKTLVPICNYVQTVQTHQTRVRTLDSTTLQQQRLGSSENDMILLRSSLGSLDPATNGVSNGYVNNNDNPQTETQPVNVHNREHVEKEAEQKIVKNNKESMKTMNQSEDEVEEYD